MKRFLQLNVHSILAVCVVIMLLSACGEKTPEQEKEELKEYCKSYATEYTVDSENDDGTYTISISAPNFSEILSEVSDQEELTIETLKKAVEDHPDITKEYQIFVENKEQAEIDVAFFEQVSYDLVVGAITDIEVELEEAGE